MRPHKLWIASLGAASLGTTMTSGWSTNIDAITGRHNASAMRA